VHIGSPALICCHRSRGESHLLHGWVVASIASFCVVTVILTGKVRRQRVQGAVMWAREHTRKREGNVGLTWGAAEVGSLNCSWRNLPTDGNENLIGDASGVQS
jgi:hypothetical protein